MRSTAVHPIITFVVTFIITLVVTALISVIITSLYYKHLIDRKTIKKSTPPDFCYKPILDGVSGNMKLPRLCLYCRHKFKCHKDANDGRGLRVFRYAKGQVFFTHIESEPKVEEINYEW